MRPEDEPRRAFQNSGKRKPPQVENRGVGELKRQTLQNLKTCRIRQFWNENEQLWNAADR